MKKISTGFILFCIVVLAFFLRAWRVTEIPPSLSWDEVSIGYNAYSILNTGRDEHGRFLPIDTFVAFGDYKPPVAIYVTVPFVAFFGLNELSVRLPSVFAGTLAVFLTYFIVYALMKKSNVALLTSVLVSISPWHIQLSRAGFEANIALTFILWGAYLVLHAREKASLFLWCWLPFVLAMYTFNSARYSGPLITLGLIFFCWKDIKIQIQKVIVGFIIALIATIPMIPHLFSSESRLRFTEVNIFSDAGIVTTANGRMQLDKNAWWARLLHNRRIGYARSYLTHFLDNVEPWFLFIRGDGNPKFSIQDTGQLYLIELPFLILGILGLFSTSIKISWFSLFWIIAALLPAATARETPHALRIENSLPMWQLFIAYAIISNFKFLISKKKKLLYILFVIMLYIANFGYYWHNYYNHYATEYSGEWQWGYREAVYYVSTIKYQYDRVIIDDVIGRPYIYTLFYDRFDPKKFQTSVNRSADAAGFFHVYGFDQYQFVDRRPTFEKQTLYVLRPQFVPNYANVLETISTRNGSAILVIFDIVDFPKTL